MTRFHGRSRVNTRGSGLIRSVLERIIPAFRGVNGWLTAPARHKPQDILGRREDHQHGDERDADAQADLLDRKSVV